MITAERLRGCCSSDDAFALLRDLGYEVSPIAIAAAGWRRAGIDIPWTDGRDVDWSEAVGGESPIAPALPTDANQPYLLLYTSGSTGKPKGAVHGHAGFPVKVQIDQFLCFDVKPGDRMLWFTDMGWMMGPFLVLGALGLGAAIVLYEGTPDYPTPDRLWEVVARHKATHLGIAPTAIRSLMVHGDDLPHRIGPDVDGRYAQAADRASVGRAVSDGGRRGFTGRNHA